jgi:hypothetical protein
VTNNGQTETRTFVLTVLCAATGFLSELIYEYSAAFSSGGGLVFATGLGWGIIGIGFTISLTERNWKHILGCVLAGLAGGFIAGTLFGLMSMPEAETGSFIKLLGAVVMALLIGGGMLLLKKLEEKAVTE